MVGGAFPSESLFFQLTPRNEQQNQSKKLPPIFIGIWQHPCVLKEYLLPTKPPIHFPVDENQPLVKYVM